MGMPQLRDVLHQMDKGILPKATFVVNSGTGLHLHDVLTYLKIFQKNMDSIEKFDILYKMVIKTCRLWGGHFAFRREW